MASISEEEDILEAAVTGIPRVAEAVASIPEKARSKALAAVESTYRQTMLDLGYEEGPAEGWVSAMMLRLQVEVAEQETAKQGPTSAFRTFDWEIPNCRAILAGVMPALKAERTC
jgi:hypothetical protein